MKTLKKLLAVVVSAMMVLAMMTTAFAADPPTYSITINDVAADADYAIYQIFTGDVSVDGTSGEKILSNVKWGADVEVIDGAVTVKGTSYNSAEAVAVALAANQFEVDELPLTDSPRYTSDEADTSVTFVGLPSGYYLVENSATKDAPKKDQYLVVLGSDVTLEPKKDIPTAEKKVQENVKNVTGNTDTRIPSYTLDEGYNDVADYNIGDKVPFQLIGTLPDNLDEYKTYKYIFHDTLSNGFTYNKDAKVYVINEGKKILVNSGFDVTYDTACVNVTITFNDIKTLKDEAGELISVSNSSYIVVEYTATLNENAVIGLDGNTNEVYLQYSNNPNEGGEGETNNTETDKVIVFTYELDTTKVSGTEYVKASEGTDDAHKDSDGYLLDDDGNKVPVKLSGAEFKLRNDDSKWAIVDSQNRVTGWANTEEGGSTLTSDADGLFKVVGLDDGTYYLKETKAPSGYNLPSAEFTVVISANTQNNQSWTSFDPSDALKETEVESVKVAALAVTVNDVDGTGDATSGIAAIKIENNKGYDLPDTGSIGTTIFYVVGGILVIGAGILLVTKKRMNGKR